MALSIPERIKRFAKKIFRGAEAREIEDLYKNKDFLEAYKEHTDRRVDDDPRNAIGGMWGEIGKLQFDFLVEKGLSKEHRMLDIGCGTLRGGRFFIDYLDPGNYTGIDLSPKAIEFAGKLVAEESLSDKRPRLLVNKEMNLKFKQLRGGAFDFLLAQSVFTHLKPEHIEECFESIGSIMHDNSVFYFTFKESPSFEQAGPKGFRYPFEYFENLADLHGFHAVIEEGYDHPRGQIMVGMTRK